MPYVLCNYCASLTSKNNPKKVQLKYLKWSFFATEHAKWFWPLAALILFFCTAGRCSSSYNSQRRVSNPLHSINQHLTGKGLIASGLNFVIMWSNFALLGGKTPLRYKSTAPCTWKSEFTHGSIFVFQSQCKNCKKPQNKDNKRVWLNARTSFDFDLLPAVLWCSVTQPPRGDPELSDE